MKLDRWCGKHLDAGGLAAVTKMFIILYMPSFVRELSSFKLFVCLFFFLPFGVLVKMIDTFVNGLWFVLRERDQPPRFARPGTFEFEYSQRWKSLDEMEKQQRQQVEKNIREAREKLEAEMEDAYHEHQANMLRQGEYYLWVSVFMFGCFLLKKKIIIRFWDE